MVGGAGESEYDVARAALRAQHEGVDTAAAADALQLVYAVLSGSVSDATGAGAPAAAATGDGATEDGESGRTGELLAALVVLRHLREEIAGWEPQLIAAARERGVSWANLAPAMGVTSRQAAERRYLRLRPAPGGEVTGEPLTGEQRVQAERSRRAGDRAVARWARQNSASLRELAGQISALVGLASPAQYHVDRVQQALGDDDPAALLPPLADAHPHLAPSHAALAEQINTITAHTEHLRRDTQDRRSGTR